MMPIAPNPPTFAFTIYHSRASCILTVSHYIIFNLEKIRSAIKLSIEDVHISPPWNLTYVWQLGLYNQRCDNAET